MKPNRLLIPGLILSLVGGIATLYLAVQILGAYAYGIFSGIVTDVPDTPFPRMRCPLLPSSGERGVVGVTLVNRTEQSLSYAVRISVEGLQLDAPGAFQRVALPAGQRASLTWPIVAPGRASPSS